MKFEDLKVGMVIIDVNNSEKRKITAIGSTNRYLYINLTGGSFESMSTGEYLSGFSELKGQKKYFIWAIINIKTGVIYKEHCYMDEEMYLTDGKKIYNYKDIELIKKYEDDFIEV